MSKPPIKTSPLFHAFVKKLIISDRDDEILRDARKELRSEIRRNFRDNFAEFLRVDAAGNYDQKVIAAARQFSEEKVKFLTQGSYAYHMLNRPQQNLQQMDLDDGIYFRMSDINDRLNLNSNLLFSFVERCLLPLVSDNHGWEMKTKPTCIRLEIGEDKHIDLPLYIVPDKQFPEIQTATAQARWRGNVGIPYFPSLDDDIWMAHRKEEWIKSDPRKIIDWVGDCKEKYGDQFRSLCRIMKAWRDHQWEESPLSSICIMRMVEMALKNKLGYSKDPNCELDYLLYEVICYMHNIVSQNISVDDPVDANKRLDSKIGNKRSDITQKLENLVEVMRNVLLNDKQSDKNKNEILKQQFGKFFPVEPPKISGCGKAAAAAAGAGVTTTQAAPRAYASENCLINAANYREITEKERTWLRENQPLLFVGSDNIIKGKFQLRAELSNKEKRYLRLHQFTPESPDESYLEDSYRIHFGLNAANGLPEILETEGKVLEQLEPHGVINKIDAHIYPTSGMLCLGSMGELRMKTREDSTLPFITNELITPYFYYHSYWAKFGEEPWSGLPHGDAGLLQNYYEQRGFAPDPLDWLPQLSLKTLSNIIYNQKIERNSKCLCPRRVKAKKCNCGAVAGYNSLQKKITKYLRQQYNSIPLRQAQDMLYKPYEMQAYAFYKLSNALRIAP